MSINYDEFPWVTTEDFDAVAIDVTRFEDDVYRAVMVYIREHPENPDTNQGVFLDFPLFGESLEEIHDKIETLMELGIFDDVDVLSHTNLYDAEGNTIGMICWNSGGKVTPVGEEHDHDEDEDDESGPTVTVSAIKPTFH